MAESKRMSSSHPFEMWLKSIGGAAVLAVKLKVSVGGIGRWRCGNRFPRPEHAARIAELSKGAVLFTDMYGQARKN